MKLKPYENICVIVFIPVANSHNFRDIKIPPIPQSDDHNQRKYSDLNKINYHIDLVQILSHGQVLVINLY